MDVISLVCGVHTIRGIRLIDAATQKVIAYRNQLTIVVVNQASEEESAKQQKKVVTQDDLLEAFHADVGVQQTQQSQQEELSLL